VGIFGYAIGVALLPLMSRQIQAGDDQAARASLNRAIEISLLLTIPAAVGIAFLASPITATLFEHGRFTAVDREKVAYALLAFSLGLPAYVLNKALTPGFFARHDTRTPVIASGIALGVNIAVNLALMKPLGHVGIAAGTSISAWINAGLLATILSRRGYLVADARLKRRLVRMVLASAIMGAALWAGLQGVIDVAGPVFGTPGHPAGPNTLRVAALSVLIGGGLAVFALFAFVLGAAERSDLALLRRARKPSVA
jgi:putative peptidoglycan lipid II flippase